ncbi:TNF receptor-associated factor 3-like [Protopterus annectens]|uniref:TNF receptor-associated factor 3-like n=1 Tax=Protopterus annectens TaxID=7888 RepID=UPI001CF9616E|nr:TNF receptor-associated factor 3-like [Protopterus annectens]
MEKGSHSEKLEPYRCPPILYADTKHSSSVDNTASLALHTLLEPVEGGFTEHFVDPISDKYKCELCHLVLCNPKQTECGHRFCHTCLETLFSFPEHACPADQEPLDHSKAFSDVCCRKEILNLEVYCRNRKSGCTAKFSLKELGVHLSECLWQPIQCPNSVCRELVLRVNLSDHLLTCCKFRLEECRYCHQSIILYEMQKHEDFECPSFPSACPNACGILCLPRSQVQNHVHECPLSENPCAYSSYGCYFKGTKEKVKEHETNSMQEHMHLLLKGNAALTEKNAELQRELQDQKNFTQKMSMKVEMLEKKQTSLEQLFEKTDFKINVTQRALTDQLLKMDLLHKPETLNEFYKDMQQIRSNIETLNHRLAVMENIRDDSLYLGGFNTALESQVKKHDDLLTIHDVQLADMDLRFQVLETTSYNGKLIWKIRNYWQRKRDAVAGKTLSLYSQPFYTSNSGYKMCARVYLNGDGMGKETHMSLFFVIMRGEYDALLPWPFRQKVTLTLMDQSSARQHISDTFKPDPKSSSFMRPVSDMNIASGCPLFLAQTVLENGGHIKDDSIFIKVTVDTSDLPVL